jgi:two-component sensor histidine kinase/PAS domain-containing protein
MRRQARNHREDSRDVTADADPSQELPFEVLDAVRSEPRRRVLRALEILDSAADPDFDRLTSLAAALMEVPVSLVTVVDVERQWFKSCFGVEEKETPVSMSFCAHSIAAHDDVTVIEDTTRDPRFTSNPFVTGRHHVRFYAGAPITVDGERVGTLCVLDRVVRQRPPEEKLTQLRQLAGLASSLFSLKDSTRTGDLARAALAREEKRRAIAVAAAGMASWVWDVPSNVVECDETLPPLFNLPPANRLRARDFFFAIDRRDVEKTEARFREALEASDDYYGEYRIKNLEPPRWLAASGRVIERDAEGKPLLVFGVNYDVTERKLAEERQRLLLRELNHRVKNTLATVQALASQTVRHAREPAAFLTAFSGRLQALGAAHGLLSDREWRGIGLRELTRLETAPFESASDKRISITGEDVLITPDQALGLGLILHELGSNALKYGALSDARGKVDLTWKIEGRRDSRRLLLSWRETGGPPVAPPQHHGFGSILISRSLAKVMDSEVKHEFPPGGVTAEISMRLGSIQDNQTAQTMPTD